MKNLEIKNNLGKIYYSAEYDAKDDVVSIVWDGFLTHEDGKNALAKMDESFDQYKYSKILSDTTKIEGSWDETNGYVANVWLPKAIGNGLRKIAIIQSPDVFATLSAEELITQVPAMNFECRIFKSKVEAMGWLRAA